MSKMNFAIALRMTTDQFKRGADAVKKGLLSIQYQVLGMASALGLGSIGLKNMVSRFVDVARETTRARVALRNISGDAQGFKNNMDFLTKTANRWGQELNGMTSEFAKFSAAASSAGISIQDQHTIFESFTRSITAFGMSSEDAHLSYLALSQMMSKGKISSEELRRQLGERMPVAIEAMARAAGVTIQELDSLLKAGKLISKDVMLPFVKEMEKMLPEVNTDNIETSVNRLKNTFTKLTQDLKIGEYFKKIVDWANGMLGNIQTSFMRIVAVIVAAFMSGKIAKAYSSLTQKVVAENQRILANNVQTEQQLELATAKRVAAEKRYNEFSALYSKASNEQKMQYYAKLTAAESAMNKARLREQAGLKAVQEANAAQTVTRWSVAFNGLKKVAVSAIATIRAAFSTILPMAVIGVIANFVMRLVEARKEAQRIKDIYKNNRDSIFNVPDTSEIQRIETLHRIIKNRLGTEMEINSAQNELLKMLGIEHDKQVDLNEEVSKRISLLKEAARADVAAQNNAQLEQRNRELMRKMSPGGDMIAVRQYIEEYKRLDAELKKYNAPHGERVKQEARLAEKFNVTPSRWGGNNMVNEILQNTRAIEYNNKILENSVKNTGIEATLNTRTPTPSGDTKVKTGKEKGLENIKGTSGLYELQKYIDDNKHKFKPISNLFTTARKQERDTTFDYKKSKSDILEEEYSLQEKFIDKLREDASKLGEYGKSAMNQIWIEEQKLQSLSDALKLQKLKEDIQEMNLSIFEQSIDGVTGFADALDRAAKSWSRIANEDMSGFERMVSIINAIGDSIKGLIGTWESYKAIQELITKLDAAKTAQLGASAATEVANISTITSAKVAADTAETASSTAKTTAIVAGLTAQEVAAKGVMAAQSTAAYAYIPFAGPALAAGQIATMQGLISAAKIASAIPGFKDGGIVDSIFTSGDRNLIRANGGEMIMTTPQQSKLWNAIRKGDFGGTGGSVELKIKGKDLVGILNQQAKIASRI